MPQYEGSKRSSASRNQQDQGDFGQAVVRNGVPLFGPIETLGMMLTDMQKSMFESPVLAQIHPGVVFLFLARLWRVWRITLPGKAGTQEW
jgi:hypothetical protein